MQPDPKMEAGHAATYTVPAHHQQPAMAYSASGTPVQMVAAHPPGTVIHVVPGTVQQPPMYVYTAPHQACAIDRGTLDLQYQTCCCHVTTAVYVIGILESISLIIGLIVSIIQWEEYHNIYYYQSMIGCVIAFVLGLLVLPALFVGVYKEKAALLLPHIVFQSLVFIGCVAGVIMFGIYAAAVSYGGYYDSDFYGAAFAVFIVMVIIFLAALSIEIFFMVQVVRCYRYLVIKTRNVW